MRLAALSFLALDGYYGQPVLSLYIYLIFLYHVNQCRVQLGTNKVVVLVVVVPASIHCYIIRQRQTRVTLYFLHSRQYLKKLLNGAAVHLSFICLFV